MDRERSLLIEGFRKNRKVIQTGLEILSLPCTFGLKDAEDSIRARVRGNNLFLQKKHHKELHKEIFNHYCKSVTTAPNKSQELAFAYGNRSAFLLHINRYKECIDDIDKALKLSSPDVFKAKLLCRKVECLKKLGSPQYQEVFKDAQEYKNKIVRNEQKSEIEKLIKKVENMSMSSKDKIVKIEIIPKTDNPLNFVEIKYNQQYGRHLIARKDYNPGDIIFVEDLYATIVNPQLTYSNCHFCLKIAWSGLPCDHCNWAIFCSEDCKLKAWKAYHDLECSWISFIRMFSMFPEGLIDADFVIRLFVLVYKEAGCSIAELKKKLAAVDECTDIPTKGFLKNGKFDGNTLQSVYSLKTHGSNKAEIENLLHVAPNLLIQLIKCTPVLGQFDPKNVEDVVQNEDAMFLGSLLMKFCVLKRENGLAFSQSQAPCIKSACLDSCRSDSCCKIGSCLGSLTSLINHSCYPNASRIFTPDKKVVIYAQHPIKKDSQIFNNYYDHYTIAPLERRQSLCKNYNFKCKCKACIQSWPPSFTTLEKLFARLKAKDESTDRELKIFGECMSTAMKLTLDDTYPETLEKADIQNVSKVIAKAFKLLKEPSELIQLLEFYLNKSFVSMYGFKMLSFGQCDKM